MPGERTGSNCYRSSNVADSSCLEARITEEPYSVPEKKTRRGTIYCID